MTLECIQKHQCFAGEQQFYQHQANTVACKMKFAVYLPPQALAGKSCATVFYLAGLTCTEETFAIKAHAQYWASQLGLILVMPDTSPRGEDVADDANWDLGQGAGFYLNATQQPWAAHFQMEDYVVNELYDLVKKQFALDGDKIGIMGHSMGGHGALTLAFKYPQKFQSVSAFAPICAPTQCPWGEKAFSHYLGDDQTTWQAHDAVELIKAQGKKFDSILVDQGKNDQFYAQLHPEKLQQICDQAGQPLTLRYHDGYDHGYYFIQSFIEDHLKHHAIALYDE
ncbi:S-formylglutathione hydrolase [Acinetobacter populi]|uniref:S-formylglutathione hydrolase n=1 Tax=Acinetobacter populi TaxID=1582270 RepID=A0A1Z9Z1Q4_9GAMM|nr:S-formylglutathione hydrolase [Acinetobacter populi]OUY08411.1 S-formylglutathione hydrolase [Acinetobacter populi]